MKLTFSILLVMLAVSFLFNFDAYDPTPLTARERQTSAQPINLMFFVLMLSIPHQVLF
jgi:hypothetical protein